MFLHEILRESVLDEDVAIRSASHLAAFAIVVAEGYDALPISDPSVASYWRQLAEQNNVFLAKIQRMGIKVEFTEHDPYSVHTDDPQMMVRYMLWDMVANRRLQIYSGHSEHPVFSPEQNVIFRTVHDYFTHGKLRGSFKQQIERMGLLGRQPSRQELAQILPSVKLDFGGNIGHTFSLRGEINAYLTHTKLASPATAPVLFTEVIGQACYQTVTDNFPEQKAAIIHGFDYKRIGVATDPQIEKRMAELMAAIDAGQTVATHVKESPMVDSQKLLAKVSR